MSLKILTTIGTCGTRLELMKYYRGICHLIDIKRCNVKQEERQQILPKNWLFYKIIKKSFCTKEVKNASIDDDQDTEKDHVLSKLSRKSLTYVLEGTPEFNMKINMNHNSTLSNEEWSSIRESTLQIPYVTEITVDSHIMNACLALRNYDAVVSYYKYLQNSGHEISLSVMRKYLSIFYKKKDQLTLSDKLEITQVYDDLCKKYPDLDDITAKICVKNMCLTDRWKDVEILIKRYDKYNKVTSDLHSSFACAAFLNNDIDIGWKYTKMFSDEGLIPDTIMESYMKYCKKYTKDEEDLIKEVEKMFQFLGENRLYPSMNIITEYGNVLKELNWSVQDCKINQSGKCLSCGTHLETSVLNNEELQLLIDSVIKNLVHGSDLFHNTNPKEWQNFQMFVERTKPYDIVIDGLNLFYQNPSQFQATIEDLILQKKKILLIMRKHLIRNIKNINLNNIQRKVYYFAAEDISEDDPYIIYATLTSGKNTYFLSRDLMRSQLFRMKSLHLKTIFKKWLLMRQMFFTKNNGHNVISQPYTYVPHAQKTCSGWHIPYVDKQLRLYKHVFYDDLNWLCLRPKH